MNAPARRFSLTKLLTASAPSEAKGRTEAPSAPPDSRMREAGPGPFRSETPAPMETAAAAAEPALIEVTPARPAGRKERPSRPDPVLEDRHPKKKRSYSVDMGVCEDLELLAWYLDRSSSSIVEELMKKHLSQNRAILEKARGVRSAR